MAALPPDQRTPKGTDRKRALGNDKDAPAAGPVGAVHISAGERVGLERRDDAEWVLWVGGEVVGSGCAGWGVGEGDD